MALKTKEAINEALENELGYYHHINGEWSAPKIGMREMIYALCNYLEVRISKDTLAVARKIKKEKK